MKIIRTIILTISILTLIGCTSSLENKSQPEINPIIENGAQVASELAYPSPLGAVSYPAPEQTEEYIIIEMVPTPGYFDKATITGYIYYLEGETLEPGKELILYLAEVMYSQETPMVAGFDRTAQLKTITDSNGRFVFTDVPFNTYSIVVDKISEAYLLRNPKTDGDLIIEVKESLIYDLGELTYKSLP